MTPERTEDDIVALLKPLPELDGEIFTQSVLARTKRIQRRSKIIHLISYICVAAVCFAALPWPSLIADVSSVSHAIAMSAEPVRQIHVLSEWLQSTVSFQNIQTPQIVMMTAVASLLGGMISFVMTDA